MSFMSDIGSFLGQAQQMRNELTYTKDAVVSSVVTAAATASDTVNDATQSIANDTSAIARDLQQSADSVISDIKQPLSKNDQ